MDYHHFLNGVQQLLQQARSAAARSVNAVMTATYWEIGRQIVVYEQRGEKRADYGGRLLDRLSQDLTRNFGRGFGLAQVNAMRRFYLTYPKPRILQSVIGESSKTTELPPTIPTVARAFPLSWTHYARLLRVENAQARAFYEAECLQGGGPSGNWTARSNLNFMSAPPFRKTKRRCWPREAGLWTVMRLCRKKKLRIRMCWNFLG